MPLRAVLFDHDGTLVDSEPVHFRHWLTVLADQPVCLSEARYHEAMAGIPTKANAAWLARHFPLTVTPAVLVERMEVISREHALREAYPLVPGARGVIEAFAARGLRMGVVTGSGPDVVGATVRHHDLAAWLPVLVSSADVTRNKPSPDGYRLALSRIGVPASDCVAFEDSATGLAAATAAGLRCCAIRTPATARHDFSAATVVVDSLVDGARWAMALD